jgi:hypothetical protein
MLLSGSYQCANITACRGLRIETEDELRHTKRPPELPFSSSKRMRPDHSASAIAYSRYLVLNFGEVPSLHFRDGPKYADNFNHYVFRDVLFYTVLIGSAILLSARRVKNRNNQ